MWTDSSECRRIISEAWNSNLASRGLQGMMYCIARCSEKLKGWNRASFGSVKQNLHRAQENLEKLQTIDLLGLHREDHTEAHSEVHKWLKNEEKMWKQRLLINWLLEGDKNTRFFHNKASQRRKTNSINWLKNSNGKWEEDEERNSLITETSKSCSGYLAN